MNIDREKIKKKLAIVKIVKRICLIVFAVLIEIPTAIFVCRLIFDAGEWAVILQYFAGTSFLVLVGILIYAISSAIKASLSVLYESFYEKIEKSEVEAEVRKYKLKADKHSTNGGELSIVKYGEDEGKLSINRKRLFRL